MAMSQAVGEQGTVIAFEPQQKIFIELCHNIDLNNWRNVKAVHAAIGTVNKVVLLGPVEPHNEGGRSIQAKGSEEVLMRSLDSYELNNVSFIKIDAENSEDSVLDGAVLTLKRCRPVLVLEIQGNELLASSQNTPRQERIDATIQKLKKMGYRVQPLSGSDYLAVPKKLHKATVRGQ
jgi:FkbM family methyltransferase